MTDKYKNKKAELTAWSKHDIVPSDLQWLCKAAVEIIAHLQGDKIRLFKRVQELERNNAKNNNEPDA